MSSAILAELAASEARAEKRLALLHDRMSHLAVAVVHLAIFIQGRHTMSDLHDAIKADLAKLDTTVDEAAASASKIAADAIAAEEAELAEIKTHIEAIGVKVEAMVPVVATATAPSAAEADTAAPPEAPTA